MGEVGTLCVCVCVQFCEKPGATCLLEALGFELRVSELFMFFSATFCLLTQHNVSLCFLCECLLNSDVKKVLYTFGKLNPGTNGAEESVIVSEVSSFQRLKYTWGGKRCPV